MKTDNVQADISRAWLLAAVEEYERFSRQIPPLARLRKPHFVIDPGLTRTLGAWHKVTRRLVLSAELFLNCDWDLVCHVLRHEAAHMLVDEYYRCTDEPPHGPTFARACDLLGIDAAATMRLPKAGTSHEHRMLRRVEKLMALGDSPNRHEAEQALAKAHELMLNYNLSAVKQATYVIRWLGPNHKRVPSYIWDIMRVLTDFYFVDYICRPMWDSVDDDRSGWLRTIEIYGTRGNLDVAEYVYQFLLRVGPQQWAVYKQENNLRNQKQKLSFLRGLYQGVHDRLTRERQHLKEEYALVWTGDPGLEAFYQDRNPSVERRRSSYRFYESAHSAGQDIGRELSIRPGVESADRREDGPRLLDG